jgi:hypothetical protein
MVHDIVNPNELWHRRFAHLHYKALPVVSKMVIGLPEIQAEPDGVCKGCAQGKNVKHSFPNSDSRAKGVLDIVHSNVCGSMSATSLSGYAYYVSFIDDYTCKTWIYLLKAKNEVFGKFKEFKALGENLTERKIKTLRSDNGGEFTSEYFKKYCKEVGIKREIRIDMCASMLHLLKIESTEKSSRKRSSRLRMFQGSILYAQNLDLKLWSPSPKK